MDRKEYDKEYKKKQRRLNTPYAQRSRAHKWEESVKERSRELSQNPARKEVKKLYAREYRKRPEAQTKIRARAAVGRALKSGKLVRPKCCEICGAKDVPLRDGRSGLRSDHYLGYDKENYLNVQFICIKCDGKQLRKKYDS